MRLTDFGLSGHLVEHGERRSQRQTFAPDRVARVGQPRWRQWPYLAPFARPFARPLHALCTALLNCAGAHSAGAQG